MRTILQRSLVAIALLAASVTAGHAGAWTQKKHHLYDRLAFNYYFADRNFDRDGDRVDFANDGEFTDYNLSNYFEYGLTDSLTVLGSLTYKRIEKDDDLRRDTTWGVGDIELGLRRRLVENPIGVFSVQTLVKIPETYDEDDPLPLGNGQYDVEGKLLYGRSLWPLLPGYTNLELGYRWRDEDPSDEIRYLVEVGFDLSPKVFTRAKLDGIFSVDNGRRRDSSGNPTTTNNFDLAKLDLTVGYKLTKAWGIEAAWTPAVYGQNTAAGATYTLAIYYSTP
ncbi:hypothetical protein [Desulfuromonas sp. TF]|uniref:hypothetical protein n=1 Tax=Desulfuromonas sp. TF TaxID=1232410 RepID=UPI0003F6AC68|nr:hypothetical protein [Desulfuromonas sp. TF]